MRKATATGLLLVFTGVVFLIAGGDATSARNVRLEGDLFASRGQAHEATDWFAVVVLCAGAVLTVRGVGQRSHRSHRSRR